MSKENVTDLTVRTDTNFLSISADGQIEVPLSLEALEKLLGGCYLEETRVSDKNLVLLAKEILSLRLKNRELGTSLEFQERRIAGVTMYDDRHSVGRRLREEFKEKHIRTAIINTYNGDVGALTLDYGQKAAVVIRDQIIAFLEQNNEPNTD